MTWVRPGLCDMLVLLKKKKALLFIEMKLPREKGKKWQLLKSKSDTDNENQLAWIEELSKVENVDAVMCFWCEDAIRVLEMAENVGTEKKA